MAIIIEFVNCLPTKFNGDILFELSPIRHPFGHFEQLQGILKKSNGHAWCKLQTSNIKNLFGLGFIIWQSTLDICVVKMILVLCFNNLLHTMKFFGVGISLGNVLWNLWSVPSDVNSLILCPPVYKLAVTECIMLFTSFEIFQKPPSTWAPKLELRLV
jgi:hypothetical protein